MTDETENEQEETPEGENAETENAKPGKASAEPENTAAEDKPAPAEGTESEADAIARLEAETADLKDKLLRAMAETENVRRRAERDKQDASKYAITGFAREMVGVADNLRRALESVSGEGQGQEEGNETNGANLESLIEGVSMTEREMINALERSGITTIDAMGAQFDHNLHEAMFEVEDPSIPAGTIVQVIQGGYLLGDRLLRPAKVGISKGGPKADPKGDPNADPKADPKEAEAAPETPPDSAKAYEKGPDTSGSQLDEEL